MRLINKLPPLALTLAALALSLLLIQPARAVPPGMGSPSRPAAAAADAADTAPAKTSIPWSQIGAKAGADYRGDGLAVVPTAEGARLRCVFQRLEGEATREGMWLTSTVTNAVNDRFRVVAAAVGRRSGSNLREVLECGSPLPLSPSAAWFQSGRGLPQSKTLSRGSLPRTGSVEMAGNVTRFTRPGLVEEYTVSMDGVRQDFVVRERPAGAGELAVRLGVSGARVEPAAGGALLVLENSGRKIAYSRLRVTDATGKELSARMEVEEEGDEEASVKSEEGSRVGRVTPCAPMPAAIGDDSKTGDGAHGVTRPTVTMLAVVVEDADAVYPVRIDPTFSDANWISMGGIPGADNVVRAAAVDGSGNLYIGGDFTAVGDVIANRIAKWNGSSWSALGSGMNDTVMALVVSGSDVYAGGGFTTAGGSAAVGIAKWSRSSWSALGAGMNNVVSALAVSGSDVYAGGEFTTAGGGAANYIAKWNGSSWSALGAGMNNYVWALAVSGNDLYAGGGFATAGGSAANRIAKWNEIGRAHV